MKFLFRRGYADEVIPLINNAKTNIDVMMYQWGYYPHAGGGVIQKLNYAIKSAIIRGVAVRVLLHLGGPSDNLRRVNSNVANLLRSWGAQVKFCGSSGVLHAKSVIIDKTFAIVGSHNFSKRSMGGNIEVSVLLEGSGDIRPLQEFFDTLWRQN